MEMNSRQADICSMLQSTRQSSRVDYLKEGGPGDSGGGIHHEGTETQRFRWGRGDLGAALIWRSDMRNEFLLCGLGVAIIGFGALGGTWLVPAIWIGGNFLALGIAHGTGAHRIFGKHPDGTIATWGYVVFLPLLLLTNAVWHILRLVVREPARNAVNETLVVGRRLLPSELNGAAEFDQYVDLTAEFSEPGPIRRSNGYLSFPILDGAAPAPEELWRVVTSLGPGRTFVHCAQGHGRTGMFALAVLLHRGDVSTIEEGLTLLKAARPGITLNRQQRGCVESFHSRLSLRESSSAGQSTG